MYDRKYGARSFSIAVEERASNIRLWLNPSDSPARRHGVPRSHDTRFGAQSGGGPRSAQEKLVTPWLVGNRRFEGRSGHSLLAHANAAGIDASAATPVNPRGKTRGRVSTRTDSFGFWEYRKGAYAISIFEVAGLPTRTRARRGRQTNFRSAAYYLREPRQQGCAPRVDLADSGQQDTASRLSGRCSVKYGEGFSDDRRCPVYMETCNASSHSTWASSPPSPCGALEIVLLRMWRPRELALCTFDGTTRGRSSSVDPTSTTNRCVSGAAPSTHEEAGLVFSNALTEVRDLWYKYLQHGTSTPRDTRCCAHIAWAIRHPSEWRRCRSTAMMVPSGQ